MRRTLEELARLGGMTYDKDLTPLVRPVEGAGFSLKNAMVVQPMEGCDGTADGSPGELTLRRYDRFARGGAGLLWAEAISVVPEGRANPRQLMLTEQNVEAFRRLADIAHEGGAKIVAQLTHSGRFSRPAGSPAPIRAARNAALDRLQKLGDEYPIASDDDIARLPEAFAASTRLAMRAGFDGVDVKACHLYLYSELLGAYERPGRYGGSYENRTWVLKESVEAAQSELGRRGILAARLNLYDAEAGGWGVGENGAPDFSEPLRLVRELRGMALRS